MPAYKIAVTFGEQTVHVEVPAVPEVSFNAMRPFADLVPHLDEPTFLASVHAIMNRPENRERILSIFSVARKPFHLYPDDSAEVTPLKKACMEEIIHQLICPVSSDWGFYGTYDLFADTEAIFTWITLWVPKLKRCFFVMWLQACADVLATLEIPDKAENIVRMLQLTGFHWGTPASFRYFNTFFAAYDYGLPVFIFDSYASYSQRQRNYFVDVESPCTSVTQPRQMELDLLLAPRLLLLPMYYEIEPEMVLTNSKSLYNNESDNGPSVKKARHE